MKRGSQGEAYKRIPPDTMSQHLRGVYADIRNNISADAQAIRQYRAQRRDLLNREVFMKERIADNYKALAALGKVE